MNIEYEIQKINARLDNLQESFLQSQRNQVPITGKVDDTNNKVTQLTPYTETKTAYIGDTEVIFTINNSGNLTVYFDNGNNVYSVSRSSDRITVSFEPLEEVTQITISIL